MPVRLLPVALALCAAIALTVGSAGAAELPGTPGVRAAVTQFYAALNTMFTGRLEPMIQVWSHRPDVTYMGPGGGFRHGWLEVLADWEGQAKMKLGGSVEPKDITITVGRDLAVVSDLEVGHNVVDGKRQDPHLARDQPVPPGERYVEDDRASHGHAALSSKMTA